MLKSVNNATLEFTQGIFYLMTPTGEKTIYIERPIK